MTTVKGPDDPIVSPPAGVVSNFDHPSNRNSLMNGLTSFCLVITFILLGLRAYGKIRHFDLKFTAEDYLVIPAAGTFIAFCVFIYRITATTGYFVHGWDMQFKNLAWHYFNIFLTTTMYNATMIFLKTAILMQWARIFAPASRNLFWWLCYIVAGLNIVFYLFTVLFEWLRCYPLAYHWDKTVAGGHCTDAGPLSPLSAIVNLVFDVFILVLPQRIIWKLGLPAQKKLGVSLVFVVGILACIFAAVRLSHAVGYLSTGDYAYDPSWQILFGLLEMTFGFLTFCLPACAKPFAILTRQTRDSLERLLKSSFGAWSGSSRSASVGNMSKLARSHGNDGGGLLPLRRLDSLKSTSSDTNGQVRKEPRLEGNQGLQTPHQAIIRTTNFQISEESITDDIGASYYEQTSWHRNKPASRHDVI